jgi:antirestriction protein ArdC
MICAGIPHREAFHSTKPDDPSSFPSGCTESLRERFRCLRKLIAGIGGWHLVKEHALPRSHNLSKRHAYLDQWLKASRSDLGANFRGVILASKIADFILSFNHQTGE